MDILLATCSKLPELDRDEHHTIRALERLGLRAKAAVWDDPHVDWSQGRLCLLRCTWDYHERLPEFLAWAERVDAATTLLNPLPVIRWNSNKTYLRDLSEQGIPIVPTVWVASGSGCDLPRLLEPYGWEEVVIKPTVSAAAIGAKRVRASEAAAAQAHLDQLLETKHVMIQPYLDSVEAYGERSLIFVNGELTHAIRRNPALSGEPVDHFRVFEVEAAPDEEALAREILARVPEPTLYARVDLVRDSEGNPRLMELELIEPSLFLGFTENAATRFAEAIADRYARASALTV